MKKLSMFIDESGDFDLCSKHAPFYLFTILFHVQNDRIYEKINNFDNYLKNNHYNFSSIHTGPLIRREKEYHNMSIDERRKIFIRMYHFSRSCDIKYKSFVYKKADFINKTSLESRMARDLQSFINEILNYFQSFDEIIVYYDNGQVEITRILNSVLNHSLNNISFTKVYPSQKRLFQVADFLCTIELLEIKRKSKTLTRSEKLFFHKPKEPYKPYIKTIFKMRL